MNFLHKLSLGLLFSFCVSSTINAQKVIDINSSEKSRLKPESALLLNPNFDKVERVRTFNYNRNLRSSLFVSEGDTLALNFFEDKEYKSVITFIAEDNGRTKIASKILDGTDVSFCYIVTSEKGITISASLPLKDEFFSAASINGVAYLAESKLTRMSEDELLCGQDAIDSSPSPDVNRVDNAHSGVAFSSRGAYEPTSYEHCHSLDEPTEITVMFVYTQAAEDWAAGYWNVTDIHDAIDITMLSMNQVMNNSKTGITFRMVHKHKTDYVELDSSQDLANIRTNGDGIMDEVHGLRSQYEADLVVFTPMVSFTGGLAGVLYTEAGDAEWCGFSLTRIQQMSWTHTTVHEIGHNMGLGHHKEQKAYAGPGLYEYSAGWRGVFPETEVGYTTVMTYEDGRYFDDGLTYPRIPYFSSVDITLNGEVIGDPMHANAVLSLKKTKYLTSKYLDERFYIVVYNQNRTYGSDSYPDLLYRTEGTTLKEGDKVVLFCDTDNTVGAYPITARIMRDDVDVSCEYHYYASPGILTVNPRKLNVVTGANHSQTYTGEKQQLTNIPTLSGTFEEHHLVLSYEFEKDGVITDYALDAGVYSVTITGSGNENFQVLPKTISLTMNRADPQIVVMDKIATYSGSPIGIDVPQAVPSGATLVITYTGVDVLYPESEQAPLEVGVYAVKVSFDGDNNYLAKTVTVQLEITSQSTGIWTEDSDDKPLQIYPTSVSKGGSISIEMSENNKVADNSVVEFYNMAGVCVLSEPLSDQRTLVRVPQIAGTYVVKLKADTQFIGSTRIIVK